MNLIILSGQSDPAVTAIQKTNLFLKSIYYTYTLIMLLL